FGDERKRVVGDRGHAGESPFLFTRGGKSVCLKVVERRLADPVERRQARANLLRSFPLRHPGIEGVSHISPAVALRPGGAKLRRRRVRSSRSLFPPAPKRAPCRPSGRSARRP